MVDRENFSGKESKGIYVESLSLLDLCVGAKSLKYPKYNIYLHYFKIEKGQPTTLPTYCLIPFKKILRVKIDTNPLLLLFLLSKHVKC